MSLVRNDNAATGEMNSFESTASFLLPHNPVAKKRISTVKNVIGDISDMLVHHPDTSQIKSRIFCTGVHLRYHDYKYYRKLADRQMEELNEHRYTLKASTSSRYL